MSLFNRESHIYIYAAFKGTSRQIIDEGLMRYLLMLEVGYLNNLLTVHVCLMCDQFWLG